jgi:hypothetical protein
MSTNNIKTDFTPEEKKHLSAIIHSSFDLVVRQAGTKRMLDVEGIPGKEVAIAPYLAVTATKTRPHFAFNPLSTESDFKQKETIELVHEGLYVTFNKYLKAPDNEAQIIFEKGAPKDLKALHDQLLTRAI